MDRTALEHIIRAVAALTNEYEIVVIGSQSILGSYPNAAPDLTLSMEADVYPLNNPDLAAIIDGAIGEMSPFNKQFGYYAQGVGPETAILPEGWKDRLVRVQNSNTDQYVGYCLEVHDLAASKLAAGRPKDGVFVEALWKHHLINLDTLCKRIDLLPISKDRRTQLKKWIEQRSNSQRESLSNDMPLEP